MSKKITKMTRKTIGLFLVLVMVMGVMLIAAPAASATPVTTGDALARALREATATTTLGGNVDITERDGNIGLTAAQTIDLGGHNLTVDVNVTGAFALTIQGRGTVTILNNRTFGTDAVNITENVVVDVSAPGATIGGTGSVVTLRNNATLVVYNGANFGGNTLRLRGDTTQATQSTTLRITGPSFDIGTRQITPNGGRIEIVGDRVGFSSGWAGAGAEREVTFYGPGTVVLGANGLAGGAAAGAVTVAGGATLSGTVAQLGGLREAPIILDRGTVNFTGVPAGPTNFGHTGTAAFEVRNGGGRINVNSASGVTTGIIALVGDGNLTANAPAAQQQPRSLTIGGNGQIENWTDTALHQHLGSITLTDSVTLQSTGGLTIGAGKTLTIETGATLDINHAGGLTLAPGTPTLNPGLLENAGTLALRNNALTLQSGVDTGTPRGAVFTNEGRITAEAGGRIVVQGATTHANSTSAQFINGVNGTVGTDASRVNLEVTNTTNTTGHANVAAPVVTNNGTMFLGDVELDGGDAANRLGTSLVNNRTLDVNRTLTVSPAEHAQAGAASVVNNENAILTVTGASGTITLGNVTVANAPGATFVNNGTVEFTGDRAGARLTVGHRTEAGASRPTFTNNGLVRLNTDGVLEATTNATHADGLIVNSANGTIISRSPTASALTNATFQNRGVVAYGTGVGSSGRLGTPEHIRGDGIIVVVGPATPGAAVPGTTPTFSFGAALGANATTNPNWNYITLYGNHGRFERLDNAEQLLVGGPNAFNINLGQLAPFNLLPTRTNFELTGWNTRMDGTGSPVEIGGTVQIIADTPIPGQPVPNVYQAQWAAVAVDPGPGREWATMPRGEVAAHFIDVRAAAWYTPYVGWALANRITTGRPEGSRTFQPARILDRATFVTFLWRMAGTPAPSGRVPTFTDQATIPTWAADAVAWASSANVRIARGFDTDNTLRPLADVSRQEMAVFLHRFVGYMGLNDSVPAGGIPAGYVDRGQVTSWARGAVAWAVDNGVMGVNTDSLSPTDSANRAEAVAMLQRVAIGFRIPAPNLG